MSGPRLTLLLLVTGYKINYDISFCLLKKKIKYSDYANAKLENMDKHNKYKPGRLGIEVAVELKSKQTVCSYLYKIP